MRITIDFASRQYVRARKLYLALAGALAGMAALTAVNVGHYTDSKARAGQLADGLAVAEARLDKAEDELDGLRARYDARELKRIQAEAAFAGAAIRSRVFSWTLFLNRLEALVPQGVGVTAIKPNFNTLDVDISGTAEDMDALTRFIERLTGSEYFEDVPPTFKTNEVEVDRVGGKRLQVFNLKIGYRPGGDAGVAGGGPEGEAQGG